MIDIYRAPTSVQAETLRGRDKIIQKSIEEKINYTMFETLAKLLTLALYNCNYGIISVNIKFTEYCHSLI